MDRSGVNILAGTDASGGFIGLIPGRSLYYELVLLVKAGLTPLEVLRAATLNSARFLGKEKEIGTVERGKPADLVLLDANPLDQITNTQKIAAIVEDGRYIDRSALQKMLSELESMASKR
jgi:imidazolonepropionase-like amidohydrolase